MHRALPALALTATGVGLVLSFDTSPSDGVELVGEAAAVLDHDDQAATTTPATTAEPGTIPSTGPVAADTTAPTTTEAPATTGSQTITGPVASTRYGPVQVQVVVADGRLVDVVALQLPAGDRQSTSISTQAEPVLRRAALAAQSADIDAVSGATFTWRGYVASLQAALDAAGL